MEAHGAQPVEQCPRILQHDARLPPLGDELRDELAHALVAPVKDLGVVPVAVALARAHVLQVADEARAVRAGLTRGDERLVHVQGAGERGPDATEVDARVERRRRLPHHRAHRLLVAREVGDAVDDLGQVWVHAPNSTWLPPSGPQPRRV